MQILVGDDVYELVMLSDTSGNPVNPGGGGGGGPDRELVTTTYLCKNAFTGASVGDTITSTQVIDVSATPVTVSVIWRNQTTAADLAGAPSAANLGLVGTTALTDGQLRATPVPVSGPLTDAQLRAAAVPISAATLPLPTGAATSAGLTTINSTLGAPMQQTGGTVGLVAGAATIGSVNVLGGNVTAVNVNGSGVTQPVSIAATVAVSAASLPLPTGAATETTLAAASAKLPATLGQKTSAASLAVVVASDQTSLPVTHLTTQRTAGLIRVTGAGTVAAGARSVSFANTGAANATVTGAATILKAGEIVSFTAQTNDTLGAISYSGTGTEILIAEVR